MTYKDLIDAMNILAKARIDVFKAESGSPAWRMLHHAASHLEKQAEFALRGEVSA
jgi:hypothetical protein